MTRQVGDAWQPKVALSFFLQNRQHFFLHDSLDGLLLLKVIHFQDCCVL